MKNFVKDNWPAFFVVLVFCIAMLCSCSTVHKTSTQSKVDSTSVTVTDSVHVKKYDTSVITHELNEYQTKTIEVFDTVHITKDSVITVLRTRTIWAAGTQEKSEVKAGTGIDSSVNKGSAEVKLTKSVKTTEKDSTRFPWWLIAIVVVCGGVIYFLYKKFL